MFDPVPWFVGGGAHHSPEVARLVVYALSSGVEGIVSAGDLRVQPLSVPGTAVRVMPGAAMILNRATGGSQQTYVMRAPTETSVDIAATGSGSGRSDLIVARVEDPNMPGEPWQDPDDVKVGPYVYPRVISNVPAGTTRLQDVPGHEGDSGVPLARIDIPASTGTITAAMIKDLRSVAIPLIEPASRAHALVTGQESTLTATSAYPNGGQTWPVATEDAWGEIPIPEWATRCRVKMEWHGVLCTNNSWGNVWIQVAPTVNPNNHKTQAVNWDAQNAAGNYRTDITAADDFKIPEELRGTSQKFYPRARKAGGSGTTKLDALSSMWLEIVFYNEAV